MSKIITDFIKNTYNVNLTDKDYAFISEFTFLWSFFESTVRKSKSSSVNLNTILNYFNQPSLNKIYDKIKLPDFIHYDIDNSNNDVKISIPNIDFQISLFPTYRKNEFKWFIDNFDSNSIIESDNNKKFKIICFVIYRFRNNLFHGNKKFVDLHEQEDIFKILNKFMIEVLDYIKISIKP